MQLQVDGNNSFSQTTSPKPISSPRFNSMDFPGLPSSESHSGLSNYVGRETHQPRNLAHEHFPFLKASASHIASRGRSGAPDFASTVRRLASQDSGHWKLERSTSPPLSGLRGRQARAAFAEKMQQNPSPAWLETGDAVGMLSISLFLFVFLSLVIYIYVCICVHACVSVHVYMSICLICMVLRFLLVIYLYNFMQFPV